MAEKCRYFQSAAWEERLTQFILHAWDVETFLRKAKNRDSSEAALEEISSEQEEVDTNTLAQMPIGDALEQLTDQVNITPAEVHDTWLDHNQDRIPESCPHEIHASGERFCLFHSDPASAANQYSSEDVSDLVAETICKKGADNKCFVGARFKRLDLANKTLSAADNHTIDFRYTTILEEASFTETVFDQDVKFKGATFRTDSRDDVSNTNDYDAHYVDFKGDFDFMRAEFQSEADFKFCTFEGDLRFNSTKFAEAAMFNYATFGGRSDFMAATFGGKADFSKAQFHDVAYLNGTYNTAGIFNYTVFEDDVVLYRTTFDGKAEFFATVFGGDFDATYAVFNGTARFKESSFYGTTSFENGTFADELQLRRVTSQLLINFRHTTIDSGSILLPEERFGAIYDFSHATLGRVTFDAPAEIADKLFEYLVINQTRFVEFNFNEHQEFLKPSWKLHTTVGEDAMSPLEKANLELDDLNTLEATYNRAKIGAKEVGHNKAASEFFFREMSARRKQYYVRFWETPGFKNKFVLIGRWISNATIFVHSGYGERPSYAILSSFVWISLFAVFYWLLPSDPPTSGVYGTENLLFSIQSFVTLILGTVPEDTSALLQLVSATEGFVGASLIALLVFTLTRSIHR